VRELFSRFRKIARPERETAKGLPISLHHTETAALMLRSGLFDHSYYARVSGELSLGPAELARHYLAHGLPLGLSPHPLIELDFLPSPVRDAVQQPDGAAQLCDYLRSPAARLHSWGPVFDPRTIDEDPVTVLAALGPDTPLPVPEDYDGAPPTLSEARAALLAFADEYREQFEARLPPRRKRWDRAATQDWVSQTLSLGSSSDALVSVIMPVLDRAEVVGAAIESVLAQTHENFELIVVDDGSTDSTRDVVTEHARADPRVRLVASEHGGVSAARNVGLAQARGHFVAFLDSDNRWTRRFLQLSLTALAHSPQAVASHAGLRLHNDDAVEFRGGDAQLIDLQLGNSIDLNVLVVRSEALQEVGFFDTGLRRWVDYDLVLRLAKLGRLEYLPFIGCDYENKTAAGRITAGESLHWQWVVRERNLIDWSAVREATVDRVQARTSVIMTIAGSTGHAARSIDRLIDTFRGDLEVIIVDNGSRPAVGRRLVLRYLSEPRVRYLRLPTNNNFALAANYGFAHATGAQVAFLDSDADARDGWLDALIAAQRDTASLGVQSLLLNPNYTVQHAGYAFYAETFLPSPMLADLTIDDAMNADVSDVTAISASASLYESWAFAELSGFDPLYANGFEDVDLCLRARRDIVGARFSCTPLAIVIHERKPSPHRGRRHATNMRTYADRWSDVRLPDDRRRYESLSMTAIRLAPVFGPSTTSVLPVLMRSAVAAGLPSEGAAAGLRWAIKTGVPCTRGGDRWGDIPFANDLAAALRSHGQQVVIDRHDAWTRPTSYLDDVVLTLRGRHPVPPQPGAFNIMWVISRPDLVTIDEVRSYDLVFAASEKWAKWMSDRSGRTIEPLLQATSPDRFRPDLERVDDPDDIIFVGGSHGHEYGRAIVGLAIQADAPIGLWGPGWEKFAPAHAVREGYLDTDILPQAYRSANIVLNDHYADMAKWGFINNRTFDAIACGTPMISDPIEGLELFKGAVVVADSVERMRELVEDRSWMPSADEMTRLADVVRSEHTFDARARRLLSAALTGLARS